MFDRRCALKTGTLKIGVSLAVVLAALVASTPAHAQSVLEGYRVSLSRFGGDGTLPDDLGFVCLWDDGVWTMTDFLDVGWYFDVGNKTYLLGGVEGQEHLSMLFKRRKGDLVLGAPANATDLPGQDLLIVASARRKRDNSGCTGRGGSPTHAMLESVTRAGDRRRSGIAR